MSGYISKFLYALMATTLLHASSACMELNMDPEEFHGEDPSKPSDYDMGVEKNTMTIDGTPVSGAINFSADFDWHSFYIPAARTCTIETILDGTLPDSKMYLYGPNSTSTFIEYDDNDGPGQASRIVRALASDGSYYVKVTGSGSNTGSYHVRATCVPNVTPQVVAGSSHTCALLSNGAVRCWGAAGNGQLGYGNTNSIGDNETPASAGDVNVGGLVIQLAAGSVHTCALLDTGAVRCWGYGGFGRLGYGNTNSIGDNEMPASAGDVNVGRPVTQVVAGDKHTCALLDTGAVRCWGYGYVGQLGYGITHIIGDNETPASAGDVNVGRPVVQLAAGLEHTCALLDTGAVRCWGYGSFGQLGYGNTQIIGDNETPASAGDVNVGRPVTQVAAGDRHTCARLDTGAVRCWGYNYDGQLGYGHTNKIGDNESPASAGDVNVGRPVTQVAVGHEHTCARLDTGAVRCWGSGGSGRLGYGSWSDIGDNETPASAGDVNVGRPVTQLTAGGSHTCARLDTGTLRCWGRAYYGQLGYGNQNDIGDDDLPSSAGDVPYL